MMTQPQLSGDAAAHVTHTRRTLDSIHRPYTPIHNARSLSTMLCQLQTRRPLSSAGLQFWCGFLPPLSCVWAIISDCGREGRAEIHSTANTEGRREEWVTRSQKPPQKGVGGCRHGPFSRETSAGAVLWCRNLQMWEGRAGVSEQRAGAMKIFPILPCLYLASSFFWEGPCPLSLAGLACRVTHSVFARPRSGSERFCSLPPALKMIGLPRSPSRPLPYI